MNCPEIDVRNLRSNHDLYAFLLSLSRELGSNGELDFSQLVETASRFGSGSASEFFHEADQALRAVQNQSKTLSELQRDEINAVILQISNAFDQVGGA